MASFLQDRIGESPLRFFSFREIIDEVFFRFIMLSFPRQWIFPPFGSPKVDFPFLFIRFYYVH